MRWTLVLVPVLAALPVDLTAQTVVVGPQVVLADYHEVSSGLRYRGAGLGVSGTLAFKKAALDVVYGQLAVDPANEGTAVESFTARQFDLRLRYSLTGGVSAEVGVLSRRVEPEFAAQAVGAGRVGVQIANAIGAGVRLSLRGAYLWRSRFSGGGAAPFGMEVGLAAGAEVLEGRGRLTAEYEFQYFNRRTDDGSGEVSVPIQQALVRLGAALAF